MTQYQYSDTSPQAVQAALSREIDRLQESGGDLSRSANSNVIVLLSDVSRLLAAEEAIDTIAVAYPARFFLVIPSDDEISVAVSVRCHGLGKDARLCSEVIRITGGVQRVQQLTSVIRNNLVTGLQSELFLFDQHGSPEALEALLAIVDGVLLDSQEFEVRFRQLETVARRTVGLADLQWVRLGIWRDELKSVFSKPALAALVSKIRRIRLSGASRSSALPAHMLLYAGWIVHRLGLVVRSCGKTGFECSRSDGTSVLLSVDCERGAEVSAMHEVFIEFESPEPTYVKLSRRRELEVTVLLGELYRSSRHFEDDGQVGLLRRYFFIGESFRNYRASLAVAIELSQLHTGFFDAGGEA